MFVTFYWLELDPMYKGRGLHRAQRPEDGGHWEPSLRLKNTTFEGAAGRQPASEGSRSEAKGKSVKEYRGGDSNFR